MRLAMPGRSWVDEATAYDGGWLVADDRWLEGTTGLTRFDRARHRVWSACSTSGLQAADGLVAWHTWPDDTCADGSPTSDLYLAPADGSAEVRHQRVEGPMTIPGIVGERLVFQGMFAGRPWVTDLCHPPERIPSLGRVVATDGDHLVGGTRLGSEEVGAVLDLVTGQLLWSRVGWLPLSFSPGGRWVVARHGEGEREQWALLDARSGRTTAALDPPSDVLLDLDLAWEDARSLLVAAAALVGHQYAVLRWDVHTARFSRATDLVVRPVGLAGPS